MASGDEPQKTAEQTSYAIGRFVYEFSQLEYTLRHYLGEEINLEEQYFDTVLSHDFGQLCTVVKVVFLKSRGPNFTATLDPLIKRCHGLNEDRKRVAHGLWVPHMEGGAVHYVARNSLKPSRDVEQAIALQKRADDACNLRAELERLF